MTLARFATYRSARRYYSDHQVMLTERRPVSLRSRLLAGLCAAAVLGGTLFAAPVALAAADTAPTLAAVGAWTFYNEFKKYLGNGDAQMDGQFRVSLFTSASNAATATLSIISEVTNEVTEANGYSSSGKALVETWGTGASASEFRFDATAVIWTATGGNIANIKYAVIWASGASAGARKLVCYSQLSTSQFTVTTGNTLTLTPSANGIFELN